MYEESKPNKRRREAREASAQARATQGNVDDAYQPGWYRVVDIDLAGLNPRLNDDGRLSIDVPMQAIDDELVDKLRTMCGHQVDRVIDAISDAMTVNIIDQLIVRPTK